MFLDVPRYSVWLSITITGSVTQIVKVSVGRPRPGGFNVLGWMTPQPYSFRQTSSRAASPWPVPKTRCGACRRSISVLRRQNTCSRMAGVASRAVIPAVRPSMLVIGVVTNPECSVSFAGLGFLTFYLAGKLRLFDTRGHAVSTLPIPSRSEINGTLIAFTSLCRARCGCRSCPS